MRREDFDIAAGLVYRIDKLEKTIFKLEQIKNCNNFKIIGENYIVNNMTTAMATTSTVTTSIELNSGDIATEVFSQDILDYYTNTLNLELNELRVSLDIIFPKHENDTEIL